MIAQILVIFQMLFINCNQPHRYWQTILLIVLFGMGFQGWKHWISCQVINYIYHGGTLKSTFLRTETWSHLSHHSKHTKCIINCTMSSSLPLFLWCIIRWNMNGKRKSYLSLPVESKGSSWSTTYFSLDLVDRKQATLVQRSHQLWKYNWIRVFFWSRNTYLYWSIYIYPKRILLPSQTH